MAVGFKNGIIILDEPRAVYYAGQVISGRVSFSLNTPLQFAVLNIVYNGEANVFWKELQVQEYNGVRRNSEVRYKGREEYFNYVQCLAGGGGVTYLPSGVHNINFKYQIPFHSPSSFRGEKGNVSYRITAYIEYQDPLMEREEIVKEFEVVDPLNLNTGNVAIKQPVHLDFEEYSTSCCFWGTKPIIVQVQLPVAGYCPGQTIPITVTVRNDANTEISKIIFQLIVKERYRSQNPPSDYVLPEKILAKKKTGSIMGNTKGKLDFELVVPDMIVPNLEKCKIIDVGFFFKVIIKMSGCGGILQDDCEICLGLIPLEETGFYLQPMLHSLPKGNIPDPSKPLEVFDIKPYVPLMSYPENIERKMPFPPTTDIVKTSIASNDVSSFPSRDIGLNVNPPYPVGNNKLPSNAPYPLNDKLKISEKLPYAKDISLYSLDKNKLKTYGAPPPYSTVENSEFKTSSAPYPTALKLSNNPPYPLDKSDTNLEPKSLNSPPYPVEKSEFKPSSAPYPTGDAFELSNNPTYSSDTSLEAKSLSRLPYPVEKNEFKPSASYPTSDALKLTNNPPYSLDKSDTNLNPKSLSSPPYPVEKSEYKSSSTSYPTGDVIKLSNDPPYPLDKSDINLEPKSFSSRPSSVKKNEFRSYSAPYSTGDALKLSNNPPYPLDKSDVNLEPKSLSSRSYPVEKNDFKPTSPYPTDNKYKAVEKPPHSVEKFLKLSSYSTSYSIDKPETSRPPYSVADNEFDKLYKTNSLPKKTHPNGSKTTYTTKNDKFSSSSYIKSETLYPTNDRFEIPMSSEPKPKPFRDYEVGFKTDRVPLLADPPYPTTNVMPAPLASNPPYPIENKMPAAPETKPPYYLGDLSTSKDRDLKIYLPTSPTPENPATSDPTAPSAPPPST